jgi:branched-chain amino acid transport system ATP-binding protein
MTVAPVPPLLELRNLVKRFGGLAATDGVSMTVETHEVHAVIGPNGAGKTTLAAQISGEIAPTSGRILFAGENVTRISPQARALRGIARSFQITSLFSDLTVAENVALAIQARSGHSFRFLRDAATVPELCGPALEMLAHIGLAAVADTQADLLSHGDKRLLEMALVLAMQPRLLLLDEPMAGLGSAEGRRLIQFLAGLKGRVAILLIEHDMEAVFELSDRITVLALGQVIASGTPASIRGDARVHEAYLGGEAA